MQPRRTQYPAGAVVQQGGREELSHLGHQRQGLCRRGVEPRSTRQRNRVSRGVQLQVGVTTIVPAVGLGIAVLLAGSLPWGAGASLVDTLGRVPPQIIAAPSCVPGRSRQTRGGWP